MGSTRCRFFKLFVQFQSLLQVPITPTNLFCPDEWLCHAGQNNEKILFLVKTGIFYEFSKSGLSAPRPGDRKTGTSDVKPGH